MRSELPASEVTEIQLTPSEEIRYEKGYVLGNYPECNFSRWNSDFRAELEPLAEALLERARAFAATIKPDPDEGEDDFYERQYEAIEKFFYRHSILYVGGGIVRLVEESELPESLRKELLEPVYTGDFCDEIDSVLKSGSLKPAAKRILREHEFEEFATHIFEDNLGYVVPILAEEGEWKMVAKANCQKKRDREIKQYKKHFAKYAKIQSRGLRPQEDQKTIENRRKEKSVFLLAIAIIFGLLFLAAFISALIDRFSQ